VFPLAILIPFTNGASQSGRFCGPDYYSVVGVAAAFIKIDAEVHRVKTALKAKPRDEALKKELNGLIKAREKLLLEAQRKARSGEHS
jgi:hypothetical protein